MCKRERVDTIDLENQRCNLAPYLDHNWTYFIEFFLRFSKSRRAGLMFFLSYSTTKLGGVILERIKVPIGATKCMQPITTTSTRLVIPNAIENWEFAQHIAVPVQFGPFFLYCVGIFAILLLYDLYCYTVQSGPMERVLTRPKGRIFSSSFHVLNLGKSRIIIRSDGKANSNVCTLLARKPKIERK